VCLCVILSLSHYIFLVAPIIDASLMDQTVTVTAVLKNTTFVCNATGYPQPEIWWMRNDVNISSNEHYQITLSTPENCPMFTGCKKSSSLIILDTEPHDDGEYNCVASNTVGDNRKGVELTINGSFIVL